MQTKNTAPVIKCTMNSELVAKSIGYHGQPLQKVWEGEHGDHNLYSMGITTPDYSMYQKRQKHFAFQDRTKRLQMHLFIAKKAKELFAKDSTNSELAKSNRINEFDASNHAANDLYAEMPPLSFFLPEKVCKIELVQHLYSQLSVGDIVYCTVSSYRNIAGVVVRVLATHPPNVRVFHDLNAKAFLPGSVQKPIIDHAGNTRLPQCNDILCCEIIELYETGDRMVVGMKGQFYQQKSANHNVTLGLVSADQLPEIYKLSVASVGKSYETILEESPGFTNPQSIEHLSQSVGLDSSIFYTNMSGLRGKYPNEEYASDLRQSQASSWAFRSVAEGIEHFKEGRHSEAFQCLNKALTIDPRNVEGLVARGALYANNGSFKKAVDDFETALKINPSHANARKYMGETLVALGRSYEEDNRIDEAKKAYQDCLAIIPHHEEAQSSLNFLWSKSNAPSKLIELNDLTLPALNLKINDQNRGEGSAGGGSVSIADTRKDSSSKKSKKKKSKNRKRHSSSSSSSDSSDSSDSSSANSSSSSDSSTSSDSDSKTKKKKKRSDKSRQKSLSPLSKRMNLLGGVGDSSGMDAASNAAYNYAHAYGSTAAEAPNEYDLRVSKFLDMTRDEDNYEEKVRKLVEEASKYTKDRKMQEEKSKKKDRKKSKKNKKDSKKKKKEKKSKSSKKDKDDLIDGIELREALKIFTKLPLFEMNAKKLSEIENVEKTLIQLKEEEKKLAAAASAKPSETSESKWKMMFAKDSKKEVPIPKQYAFPMDDEADSDNAGRESRESRSHRKSPERKAASSSYASTSSRSRYDTKHSPAPQPPTVMSGPSVLDKFGSFRRAANVPDKPPEPPAYRRSRSRSRSRSASRSRSRRSRSRSSYRRSRSRSRSYSRRSYSRSRSRSGSFGGYNRRRWRGSNYRPRGNNYRMGQFNRSNNFRDFKNNRGRDRWNRGNGWVNRGGRYRNFRDDSRERRFDRRSGSYSPDRRRSTDRRSPPPLPTKAQPPSPPKENPFSAPAEQSVEEIERMLDKAKKEKQEEMLERNRDLVKTTQ